MNKKVILLKLDMSYNNIKCYDVIMGKVYAYILLDILNHNLDLIFIS